MPLKLASWLGLVVDILMRRIEMAKNEVYLIVGIIVGGVLWGSLVSLVETSGVLPIVGLAMSSLILGGAVGKEVK